jgi:hypothetical protein
MTVWHLATGWGIIGTAKEFSVDRVLPWYAEVASDMGLGYLAAKKEFKIIRTTIRNPANTFARALGKKTHSLVARGGKAAGSRAAAAAPVVAMYASAAGLGYAVGATVGTGIAQLGWGDEGARDALALYSGQVSFQEYMHVVGEALGTL